MGMGGYWVPMGMGTHCRTLMQGVMLLHSLHHVRCFPYGTFAFCASCGGVFHVGQKQLQRFLLITSFVGKLTRPFQNGILTLVGVVIINHTCIKIYFLNHIL
jgi:hypothetical protein